jgi:hypothetical protein
MAMEEGQHYRCTNDQCGCEIEVTRGPRMDGGDENPRCCCGQEMTLV